MGQEAQNRNRRASLDEKKERAAGRRNTRAQKAGREQPAKGKTGGAFGKHNVANPRSGNSTREGGGGGGGASTPAKASAAGGVGRSTKRTRKRSA
jgi:hypothetical protein